MSDIKHIARISIIAIESCKKYLLNAYYEPESVLEAGIKCDQTKDYGPWNSYILMRKKDNKNV